MEQYATGIVILLASSAKIRTRADHKGPSFGSSSSQISQIVCFMRIKNSSGLFLLYSIVKRTGEKMFAMLMSVMGCAGGQKVAASPPPTNETIAIVQEFRGRVFQRRSLVATDTPEDTTLLIRTQEDFENFVARIPKRAIQKKQPAPPSQDPLLSQETLDSGLMMLVSMRFDNNYAYAPINKVEKSADAIHAWYSLPPLGETAMYASMSGVGTYHAVLIPADATTVVFQQSDK